MDGITLKALFDSLERKRYHCSRLTRIPMNRLSEYLNCRRGIPLEARQKIRDSLKAEGIEKAIIDQALANTDRRLECDKAWFEFELRD